MIIGIATKDGMIDIDIPDKQVFGDFAVHNTSVGFTDGTTGFIENSYSVTYIPIGYCVNHMFIDLELAIDFAKILSQVDKSILNRAVKGDKRAYKQLGKIYREWLEG